MDNEFTSEEMYNIIRANTVLELKDDSPVSKLLGIQVDMHYDK